MLVASRTSIWAFISVLSVQKVIRQDIEFIIRD